MVKNNELYRELNENVFLLCCDRLCFDNVSWFVISVKGFICFFMFFWKCIIISFFLMLYRINIL